MKHLCALLLLLVAGCATSQLPYRNWGSPGAVSDVSLVQLIGNPEQFEGKPVRVVGAFRLEFEGNAVCLHADDVRARISKNCLWISLDYKKLASTEEVLSSLNGHYVLLEGTFTAKQRGHFGMYSGSLEGVWRVTDWSWAGGGG